MGRVALAFLWHHHQPPYVDPATGRAAMPWARLHATRDYPGMALLLAARNGIRATFNLVPSLLDQLEAIVAGKSVDPALEAARKRPGDLSPAERHYVLTHFFAAPRATAIEANPRYRELYRMRTAGQVSAEKAASRFAERDFRDLQVWHNLAWFHPLVVRGDAALEPLFAKGAGFSEEEKLVVLARQREVAARVLPLYAGLESSGRVELTSTPHYHPILPLLLDPRSLREAMPDASLPEDWESLADDARVQVRRAIESHARRFGRPPRGMWPAEGSVSEAAARLFAEEKIEWIASDEGVLARSLGIDLPRDADGLATRPDVLYRPYRAANGSISIVFRDRRLSDLIGFEYQRRPAAAAVDDFLRRVRAIRDGSGLPSALVPVILDGENCWEHYPGQGVEFLGRLYDALESERDVETVTISDELSARPPEKAIPRLFAGSWIGANFSIWMGHAEDRRAWEALYRTRRRVLEKLARPDARVSEESRRVALEEILVAEGSDWYWWFGDEHTSGFDDEWDALFRTHLSSACLAAGLEPPGFLRKPITRRRGSAYEEPGGRLDVRIDGRGSWIEWHAAGRLEPHRAYGSMARGEKSAVERVFFGFAADSLVFRIDAKEGPSAIAAPPRAVAIAFAEPVERRVRVTLGPGGAVSTDAEGVEAAADSSIEVRVPLGLLGPVSPGEAVAFRVELMNGRDVAERLPAREDVRIEVPGPGSDERRAWP